MALTQYLGLSLLEPSQAQPDVTVNLSLTGIDEAIAGRFSKDMSGLTSYTLTGAESTNWMLNPWNAAAAFTLVVQATDKGWLVINDAAYDCTVKTPSGVGVVVPAGTRYLVYCDSVNVRTAAANPAGDVTQTFGVAIGGGNSAIPSSTILPIDVDLDTVILSGFYRTESGPTHAPPIGAAANYSPLIVSRGSDSIVQILIPALGANAWLRTAIGIGATPTWKTWKSLGWASIGTNAPVDRLAAGDLVGTVYTNSGPGTWIDYVTGNGTTATGVLLNGVQIATITTGFLAITVPPAGTIEMATSLPDGWVRSTI